MAVAATGCAQFAGLGGPAAVGSSPTPPLPPTPTSVTPNPTTEVQATPTPLPPPGSLTIWVPPRFNPNSESEAGRLLAQRIQAFENEHGVRIEVRVKEEIGPGSLLETLTAASPVAPLALPSLVALPRADLEVAALKGLIVPLEGLSRVIDEPDWYTYARELAMVQGTSFSLPFAGDALLVVYRPSLVVAPPDSWEAVLRLGQPVAFPAGDVQALLPLTFYRALGGEIADAQRRPVLFESSLTPTLQLFADASERGLFPFWLSQYETYGQVWDAYQEQRVNAAVVWSSYYLSVLPADSSALPLPALNGASELQTMANSWGWAVADPLPERRELAVRLAEYLTASDFLARWTEAAGYLPTRPSALAGWENGTQRTLLSPIAASARARPTNDLIASIGPVLKEAGLKILKREASPAEAARAAVERLAVPQLR